MNQRDREELEKFAVRRRVKCKECGQNDVTKRGDICEGCKAYREHTGHF